MYGNSRMMVEAVVAIFVALAVGYIVSVYLTSKPEYVGGKDFYELSAAGTQVAQGKDLPWTAGPCSIRFALFIQAAPRTVEKVDCEQIPASGDIITFKPHCPDYEFKKCACEGNNCSRCLNSTYLTPLLKYGELLEFQASGYTNSRDKPYVPALLRIKTANSQAQHFMESVSLPAVPLQKWTVITIVKEGRRFDVFYGAKQVASKILEFTPYIPSSLSNWVTGNSSWKGKIGLFSGVTKSQSSQDVTADVESLVNSRGIPYALDRIDFSVNFEMPECIFGNCGKLPDVVKQNPFVVRTTNVA